MFKFESNTFEDITIDDAYKKASELIKTWEINLDDFADLYGEEVIERDKNYVRKAEKLFAETDDRAMERFHKLATIFEAIFNEQAELSEWLGGSAFTIKASRYDDIKNGVDTIAEFREDDLSVRHLALAVDVTTSSDIKKKFDRIKNEIEEGKLAEIKYFISEKAGIRGELSKIPRVVIGADSSSIKELQELWLRKDNKRLERHHIQFLILDEILEQLRAFQKFASSIGKTDLVVVYEKAINTIIGIHKKKKRDIDISQLESDRVYSNIKSYLDNFDTSRILE